MTIRGYQNIGQRLIMATMRVGVITSALSQFARERTLVRLKGLDIHLDIHKVLRADATIDSHRSNRIVPGGQSRMSFDSKTADLFQAGRAQSRLIPNREALCKPASAKWA